jgi:hypothetical protein
MLKVIHWVLVNLPLLIGAVTAVVAVVEAMRELIKEPGPEKKKRALEILRDNLSHYLPVPDFIARHLDAILGVLIDLVVLILNMTRGHQWGQELEAAVADVSIASTAAVPPRSTQEASPGHSNSDARLDELEARLNRPR